MLRIRFEVEKLHLLACWERGVILAIPSEALTASVQIISKMQHKTGSQCSSSTKQLLVAESWP